MEWLQNNWFWFVLAAGFVAMHMFGHGGHRHGHGSRSGDGWRDPNPANGATDEPETEHAHSVSLASPATGSENQGLRAHANHAGAPTRAGENRHRHGC
jgi:hypothetical protein